MTLEKVGHTRKKCWYTTIPEWSHSGREIIWQSNLLLRQSMSAEDDKSTFGFKIHWHNYPEWKMGIPQKDDESPADDFYKKKN